MTKILNNLFISKKMFLHLNNFKISKELTVIIKEECLKIVGEDKFLMR